MSLSLSRTLLGEDNLCKPYFFSISQPNWKIMYPEPKICPWVYCPIIAQGVWRAPYKSHVSRAESVFLVCCRLRICNVYSWSELDGVNSCDPAANHLEPDFHFSIYNHLQIREKSYRNTIKHHVNSFEINVVGLHAGASHLLDCFECKHIL